MALTYNPTPAVAYQTGTLVKKSDVRSNLGQIETEFSAQTLRRMENLRDAGVIPLTNVGGSANAITADLPAWMVSDGLALGPNTTVLLTAQATNTGAATLKIGSVTEAILTEDGAAVSAGMIVIGRTLVLQRRANGWRIIAGSVSVAEISSLKDSLWSAVTAVTSASGATPRDFNTYTTGNRSVRITAANMSNGPVGLDNPLTGILDIRPAPSGVRHEYRDTGGTIWERNYTGTTWGAWAQTAGFASRINTLSASAAVNAASIVAVSDGAEVADLVPLVRDSADLYIDAADYPLGPVAQIKASGRLAPNLALTGSGDPITKTAAGLVFSGGQWLRATLLSIPAKRISVMVELTVNASRSGSAQIIQPEFTAPASLSITPGGFLSGGYNPWFNAASGTLLRSLVYFPLGQRGVLAVSLDTAGKLIGVEPDGFRAEASAPANPLTLTGIRIGFNTDLIFHRIAIFVEDL